MLALAKRNAEYNAVARIDGQVDSGPMPLFAGLTAVAGVIGIVLLAARRHRRHQQLVANTETTRP